MDKAVIELGLPRTRIRQGSLTRRYDSIRFTDGGPFVYEIKPVQLRIRVCVFDIDEYIDGHMFDESGSDTHKADVDLDVVSGVARIVESYELGAPEAYLIARFVYNLIADGRVMWHFDVVKFDGFGVAANDILVLPNPPSQETES